MDKLVYGQVMVEQEVCHLLEVQEIENLDCIHSLIDFSIKFLYKVIYNSILIFLLIFINRNFINIIILKYKYSSY